MSYAIKTAENSFTWCGHERHIHKCNDHAEWDSSMKSLINHTWKVTNVEMYCDICNHIDTLYIYIIVILFIVNI